MASEQAALSVKTETPTTQSESKVTSSSSAKHSSGDGSSSKKIGEDNDPGLMSIVLLSWNIKGSGMADQRKRVVSTYLRTLRPSADILFLQEVQWSPCNLRNHLTTLSEHYELTQYSREALGCHNCVLFDTRKFKLLEELETSLKECFKKLDEGKEWEKKDFRVSQEANLRRRMCVVILRCKSSDYKFIAASLHNLSTNSHSVKMHMAELFLLLLSKVSAITGYPVVLAGDFNVNIQKNPMVKSLGFTLPEYKPTIHRLWLKRRSPTIDFFLYRSGKDVSAVLENVGAELAFDFYRVIDRKGVINDDKMNILHKVSNHDPLQSTLQLSSTTK